MLRTVCWICVIGLAVSTASLMAQDAVLNQLYGQGVHKFFARDFGAAFEDFNAAIENGTDDPRCFYFRGLTYLQLGREDEAREDFAKGAELEMKSISRFFNVSRALERIQGRQRLMIEEYRTQARLAVMREMEKQRRARYEELRREEARVLDRSAPPVGIPQAVPGAAPQATIPAAPASPAAETQPAQATPAPAAPAEAQPTPPPMPAPAAPRVPPAADNPFSTEPAAPAAPPQPAPPAPAAPANDNPFAT